jgi:hypothetical protein
MSEIDRTKLNHRLASILFYAESILSDDLEMKEILFQVQKIHECGRDMKRVMKAINTDVN